MTDTSTALMDRRIENFGGKSDPPAKSPLVLALEARPRKLHEFDASMIIGAGDKPIGKFYMRVATKWESNKAIVDATRWVEGVCAGTELAKSDPDLILDAKTCWILHSACRDHDHPDAMSAFLSPTWMMEHLTTDQLAILLNYYNTVVDEEEKTKRTLSQTDVEKLIPALAESSGTEMSNAALNLLTRESVSDLAVREAVMITALRRHITSLETELSAAKALLESAATEPSV